MKSRTPTALVEHAGSGFLIPEETARRIENLSRGLPRDFTYRRRSAPAAELELNVGERTDVSTITTDALDRDRECVLPGGGEWSAYNRVVPFAHDYRQLPAGSCWWIKPRGGKAAAGGGVGAGVTAGGGPSGLIAKTHYPPKPADWGDAPWLPSAVLHLLQQPVPTCTGKSIGFVPLNIREATKEEVARRPELAGVPVIDRWAGIEYSVVPVPCNPEAEMLAVAKGVEAGVFDAGVAELITKAMTPFLGGWHSPIGGREAGGGRVPPLAASQTADVNSRGSAIMIEGRREAASGGTGSESDAPGRPAADAVGAKASESGAGAVVPPGDSPAAPAPPPDEPPPCPRCGGNAGVTENSPEPGPGSEAATETGPAWACDYCGEAFDAPAAPPPQAKAPGGVRPHEAGHARVEALIREGKITDAPWSFTDADHLAAKPGDFLGQDDSAPADAEARWKYPVTKGGTVYRRGVAAAESRADQQGDAAVAEAAGRLMALIRMADEAEATARAVERAASATFVRPDAIRAALRRAVEDARAELPGLIRRELREAYARATGKV